MTPVSESYHAICGIQIEFQSPGFSLAQPTYCRHLEGEAADGRLLLPPFSLSLFLLHFFIFFCLSLHTSLPPGPHLSLSNNKLFRIFLSLYRLCYLIIQLYTFYISQTLVPCVCSFFQQAERQEGKHRWTKQRELLIYWLTPQIPTKASLEPIIRNSVKLFHMGAMGPVA